MKAKQKKIRVFDIQVEDEAKFFEFMDKNFILIKDYLLLVGGEVTPKIEEYLKENSLCYLLSNECNIKLIDGKSNQPQPTQIQEPQTTQTQKEIIVQEKIIYQESASTNKTRVINKPVRSGEVIEEDSDIVIFSRINSGAKVISEGNITVFEVIDGVVEANGDFIILKSIGKGYVVFNGDILEKSDFDGSLKKVLATSDGYKIEDI